MTPEDKDMILALLFTWKGRAKALREAYKETASPLVALDCIHQADVYDECVRELNEWTDWEE